MMGGRRPKDLPSADIFIHSGDVAKVGSDGELGDFNEWHLGVKNSPQDLTCRSGIFSFDIGKWHQHWWIFHCYVS